MRSVHQEVKNMVHENNPEEIWQHDVRHTISRIRTKANTISLIKDGHYPYSKLTNVEKDLWIIAERLDSHVAELFIEIERLRKICDDKKKTYRCIRCSKEITKKQWDKDPLCKNCKETERETNQ
jgi:hypothetical protein